VKRRAMTVMTQHAAANSRLPMEVSLAVVIGDLLLLLGDDQHLRGEQPDREGEVKPEDERRQPGELRLPSAAREKARHDRRGLKAVQGENLREPALRKRGPLSTHYRELVRARQQKRQISPGR